MCFSFESGNYDLHIAAQSFPKTSSARRSPSRSRCAAPRAARRGGGRARPAPTRPSGSPWRRPSSGRHSPRGRGRPRTSSWRRSRRPLRVRPQLQLGRTHTTLRTVQRCVDMTNLNLISLHMMSNLVLKMFFFSAARGHRYVDIPL